MKMKSVTHYLSLSAILLCSALCFQTATAQTPGPKGGQKKKAPTPPPITAKPEELARIKERTEQLDALVKELKGKGAKPELVTDVEIFAHAGHMLLEYPDMFANQSAIERSYTVLDQGIER